MTQIERCTTLSKMMINFLDGAGAMHAQTDDQMDSPSTIQVPTISATVIGGVQQRLGPGGTLNSEGGSSANARQGKTSELRSQSEHRRGSPESGVRTHRTSNYEQTGSNDSNSNRSDSLRGVESALYSAHQHDSSSTQRQKATVTAVQKDTSHTTSHKDTYQPKSKPDPLASNPIADLAASFAASNRQRKQSITGGYLHHRHRRSFAAPRLSVADIVTTAAQQPQKQQGHQGDTTSQFRRRRAVEISDHKAVVLLHSKLKGMKLEDIA